MADISQVKLPDNSVYDINDATARSGLSDKMDKANPTGTGALSINRKASTTVGTNSTTLGNDGTASGTNSIAEGWLSVASGTSSHAEGSRSEASNTSAHAEGTQTVASGSASHSEGSNTVASGNYGSHAEGSQTTASGDCSHAEGYKTTANRLSQHVFGEWNVVDTAGADGTVRGNYVEIVGNGTSSSARSNARTLDWQGNETLAGDLIYNGDTSLTNKLIYEKTVSGSIASFTDGGNNIPCKSVTAQIVATQAGSGTPSPSNVREISGFGSVKVDVVGKNLVDYSNEHSTSIGNTYEYDDNSIKVNWASGNAHQLVLSIPNGDKLAGSQVTLSYTDVVPSSSRVNDWRLYLLTYINGASETIVATMYSRSSKTATITLDSNITEMRLLLRLSQSNSSISGDYVKWKDVQLEIGSTATEYEAYQNTTHTITLPETIYGGELECVGGSGNKTWEGLTSLATATWTAQGSGDSEFFTTPTSGVDTSRIADLLCNKYKTLTPTVSNTDDNIIGFIANGTYLRIRDKRYTASTINDFKTSLADCVAIYPLATPTTFTTTPESIPTLSGVNNVYADSGDVEVAYFTNNANEISDMLAPKADSKDLASLRITGTKNNTGSTISTGTFFYLNDVLVVAKADISNNATLTENTNYTVVTAGVLNSLGLLQTVTPSGSDKLLIVQSQGQGLAEFGTTIGNKAPKTDLASISITGSTNNTGSTIKSGTFFYLNDSLVRAKTDIANNATLTSGTNYEVVSAGGLNKIVDTIGNYNNIYNLFSYGSQTLENLQTIAKNSEPGCYWGMVYLNSVSIGWSYVLLVNKMASASLSEFYIYQSGKLITSYTSNLSDATPTWTTKIISQSEIESIQTVETVPLTVNSTKITSGTITCKKINHTAFVEFNGVVFANSGNNQTGIVTGLPTALVQLTYSAFGGSNSDNAAAIKNGGDTLWIGSGSTALNAHLGASYNLQHWGTFSYPCE